MENKFNLKMHKKSSVLLTEDELFNLLIKNNGNILDLPENARDDANEATLSRAMQRYHELKSTPENIGKKEINAPNLISFSPKDLALNCYNTYKEDLFKLMDKIYKDKYSYINNPADAKSLISEQGIIGLLSEVFKSAPNGGDGRSTDRIIKFFIINQDKIPDDIVQNDDFNDAISKGPTSGYFVKYLYNYINELSVELNTLISLKDQSVWNYIYRFLPTEFVYAMGSKTEKGRDVQVSLLEEGAKRSGGEETSIDFADTKTLTDEEREEREEELEEIEINKENFQALRGDIESVLNRLDALNLDFLNYVKDPKNIDFNKMNQSDKKDFYVTILAVESNYQIATRSIRNALNNINSAKTNADKVTKLKEEAAKLGNHLKLNIKVDNGKLVISTQDTSDLSEKVDWAKSVSVVERAEQMLKIMKERVAAGDISYKGVIENKPEAYEKMLNNTLTDDDKNKIKNYIITENSIKNNNAKCSKRANPYIQDIERLSISDPVFNSSLKKYLECVYSEWARRYYVATANLLAKPRQSRQESLSGKLPAIAQFFVEAISSKKYDPLIINVFLKINRPYSGITSGVSSAGASARGEMAYKQILDLMNKSKNTVANINKYIHNIVKNASSNINRYIKISNINNNFINTDNYIRSESVKLIENIMILEDSINEG